MKKGYSGKLRHVQRTHKLNLGAMKDSLDSGDSLLEHVETDKQVADIFTKELAPAKWPNALQLLNLGPSDQGGGILKQLADQTPTPQTPSNGEVCGACAPSSIAVGCPCAPMTQSSNDILFNPELEPQTSPQGAISVGCSSACAIIDSLLLESGPEDEVSSSDPPPDAIQQMHAAVGAVSSAVKCLFCRSRSKKQQTQRMG